MPDPTDDLHVRAVQRYGWLPDVPDNRDVMFAVPPRVMATLPTTADLRPQCPPVYDQGQLGSCTANAIGAAFEFDQRKQGLTDFMPSRLFIYFNERTIEGTVDSDSGAMIRDGMKSINKLGVCTEDDWPYDITKFRDQPTAACFTQAATHHALVYNSVQQDLHQIQGCLASGYPVVFGFSVYTTFESQQVAQTGEASLPQAGEQQIGGHAVLAVGYDESQQRFLIRNSWGAGWGMGGYFTLPYPYLLQPTLSSDFWTIRSVK